MGNHRITVKTQGVDSNGRATSATEHVRNVPTSQVEARRAAARQSAPAGSTRTIKVVSER